MGLEQWSWTAVSGRSCMCMSITAESGREQQVGQGKVSWTRGSQVIGYPGWLDDLLIHTCNAHRHVWRRAPQAASRTAGRMWFFAGIGMVHGDAQFICECGMCKACGDGQRVQGTAHEAQPPSPAPLAPPGAPQQHHIGPPCCLYCHAVSSVCSGGTMGKSCVCNLAGGWLGGCMHM